MSEHLSIALQAAVPIAILEMRSWAPEARQAAAAEWGQIIASHGDDILFRSARKGDSAKAFTALARGLAALAYCPGGVRFLGIHWCTDHETCTGAEREARPATGEEADR